jgi:hypothetical protein
MDTLLISKDEIVAVTTIEKNVDEQRFMSFAKQAQRRHIRQVLGVTLYQALCDAVAAVTEESPLGEPWVLLKEYVNRPLGWYTLYEAWPLLLVHITNSGLSIKASRDSDPADARTITSTRTAVLETAEFELAELKAFLEANAADYADYLPAPQTPAPASLPGGVYFPRC